MKRLNVAETNDALWRSLVQLFVDPERIHALATPSQKDDLCAMKKELADTERDEKGRKEKQERLLNLYLEGNIPQASYVVKSSELERETGRMHDRRVDLQRRIQGHGKSDVTTELIQTLRLLARSHRRFTEEQKTKVFRSIVKEARLTEAGVELVLYAQPTQNGWWKYRQKVPLKRTSPGQTVRVGIPLVRPSNQTFTVGQAAKLLGISADNLRWRIKVGKYPDAPKENGRRVFTREQVQKLEALG